MALPEARSGSAIQPDLLDERRRRHQQVDRPVDSSIVGPIARTAARKHGFAEGIVDTDYQRVCFAEAQARREIAHESGVSFADVATHFHAVHPHRGGVKDGFKLHANGAVAPVSGAAKLRRYQPTPCNPLPGSICQVCGTTTVRQPSIVWSARFQPEEFPSSADPGGSAMPRPARPPHRSRVLPGYRQRRRCRRAASVPPVSKAPVAWSSAIPCWWDRRSVLVACWDGPTIREIP